MKINRMTDYAIRVIRRIYMADNEVVTSKVLAEKEHIPHGVLMKVLNQLRACKIVESHQGRGEVRGGFSLLKDPKELTLLDVIIAMEGDIFINACVDAQEECFCKNDCSVHKEFSRINQNLKEDLNKNSLYDLLIG